MHTAQSYTEKTHSAKAFHALAGRDFSGALDHGLKVPYSTSTVTTTIPNALTGALRPKTKPNGVNPARRLLITTDANGRAAVWFTLGKQSGEAGNMVQVSGSDANAIAATSGANSSGASTSSARTDGGDAISESVVFTATGDRGVPAKILAEGGGAQYAETGGQPLDALTAVTYDGEVNPVPGAVIAYVIEQDGGVDLDDGAKFTTSSASNAIAISNNRKVLITLADNNGRSAARPTMGAATGTVRISTYAMPPNTAVRPELVEGLANAGNGTNNALTTTPGLVGLATFQIAVLAQSDGPTQFTGKILDHTGKPLQGVRVTISRTPLSVTTDAAGNFSFLQDVPQGKLDLFVDGRAVTGITPLPGGQTTPTQYPSLHFEVLAIRGQKNILPHPIYLPPLLMSQAKIVGGNEDVTLTIPGRDGFEMIVKANSVTFPDGTRIGPLVVSPVADDRLPMSPPGGGSSFMPGAAATIQPSGTRFDPPIEVRLPNTSAYAPGERVPVYHWDHDIGQFVAMGQATVTDDGAQLITDPGSGITKAGWHGPPVPPIPPNCAKNDGPTEAQCGEKCERLNVEGLTCPRPMCVADERFNSDQYSCCGGSKFDKKSECCVTDPASSRPNFKTTKSGHTPDFLQTFCPNRGQTKRNAAGNNEVCYGDEISPEGERIQAVPNGEYINFCIDGCSQSTIGAATFYVLAIAGVVDTQNPTGVGDRLGTFPLSTSFYGACREHDVCYQTCSKEDKSSCDNAMRDSMHSTCQRITPDLFAAFEKLGSGLPRQVLSVQAVCMRNAWAYYQGLVWLASGAFAERKAQYCECCKS